MTTASTKIPNFRKKNIRIIKKKAETFICLSFYSRINGGPEAASSEISWNFTKIRGKTFGNSFYFLEAEHFYPHRLLYRLI